MGHRHTGSLCFNNTSMLKLSIIISLWHQIEYARFRYAVGTTWVQCQDISWVLISPFSRYHAKSRMKETKREATVPAQFLSWTQVERGQTKLLWTPSCNMVIFHLTFSIPSTLHNLTCCNQLWNVQVYNRISKQILSWHQNKSKTNLDCGERSKLPISLWWPLLMT